MVCGCVRVCVCVFVMFFTGVRLCAYIKVYVDTYLRVQLFCITLLNLNLQYDKALVNTRIHVYDAREGN